MKNVSRQAARWAQQQQTDRPQEATFLRDARRPLIAVANPVPVDGWAFPSGVKLFSQMSLSELKAVMVLLHAAPVDRLHLRRETLKQAFTERREYLRLNNPDTVEIGKTFGNLTVRELTQQGWLCECACGRTGFFKKAIIRKGRCGYTSDKHDQP